MRRYELVDHTADVAIKAHGDSLADAFAAAADALFEILTDQPDIRMERDLTIEVTAVDREGLLVNLLSELLLVFEVDGMVLKDFDVTFLDDHCLRAHGHGEAFDEARHGLGYQVKGVSYHMMEIVDGGSDDPSYVQVLFDV